MKRKNKKLSILIVLIFVVITVGIYFKYTALPMFEGCLTIDINNTTFSQISGAIIEFGYSDKIINLPDIRPLERIIVVVPTMFDKPVKTQVYINYYGEKTEVLGEYHSLAGNKYNTDIKQYTRIKFTTKKIVVLKKGILDLKSRFNLKPYFRIYERQGDGSLVLD